MDISMLSIFNASKMIRNGELTPVELLEACLKKIDNNQKSCNAYVYLDTNAAMAKAKELTNTIRSNYRGPLHGIPIALKDIFFTKNIPTTAGSELMRNFVPSYNGTIVQRLEDAGAILIGKTNTHEWAFGPTTEESCFGPSRNPWDTKRITGGSSGGSAVAVATGMAYMAMGSDTGGSVRIPAALCGTVGYKPSFGLASLYGVVGLSFNLDHPGPLTRSVMDAAIVMDAISGYDPNDPCLGRSTSAATDFARKIEGTSSFKGKIIGVPENFFFDKTDYEVEAIVREAINKIKAAGAEIQLIKIPMLERVTEVSTVILFAEASFTHQKLFAEKREQYKAGVRDRLDQGFKYSAIEYINALKERDEIVKSWESTLQGIDAVIAPTCPITAYPIGMDPPWPITVRGKEENGRTMCTYHTRLSNLTGGPALAIPCGLSSEGLPASMMIMGKLADDATVLEIGYTYEKLFGIPEWRVGN